MPRSIVALDEMWLRWVLMQQQWFWLLPFYSGFEWHKTVFGDWICCSRHQLARSALLRKYAVHTHTHAISFSLSRWVCAVLCCASRSMNVVRMVSHSKWIMCADKINDFSMWLKTTQNAHIQAWNEHSRRAMMTTIESISETKHTLSKILYIYVCFSIPSQKIMLLMKSQVLTLFIQSAQLFFHFDLFRAPKPSLPRKNVKILYI